MSSSVTLHTPDGLWKVEVVAFKNWRLVYSSIGTEVKVFRRERYRRWYDPWYKHTHWKAAPAEYIAISNTFRGLLPSRSVSAAQRSNEGRHIDSLEEKIWSVGLGVSMDASASTGLPDPGSTSLGGVKLDVQSVSGHVVVVVAAEQFSAQVAAG